ncbi:nucleotidyltransferase family protein [Cryobacterium mannosilyticum]|uniref:Nucleotidyltransferase family protein n=2 Tax=Cryobacterium mannosilyticum TaxID=1259190 RepID=A0A4R8W4B3_9MICO|nr:NTP transferase domain-containing protein [Cryobacterium mannosilyticum]TFC01792.1 nucleotidyltransferase family protein [Cryobacterium mannosilyticum]
MPLAPPVAGLVLAAGAGSRYGRPKALATTPEGTSWLVRAVHTLAAAGCHPVIVVLGAGADAAEALLGDFHPGELVVTRAEDWADGLSASLRAGLRAAAALGPGPLAVAVVPVDVPGLGEATVRRLIGPAALGPAALGPAALGPAALGPDTLRQACFEGRPGHPVVIGRAHWAGLIASVSGDTGARPYLFAHQAVPVECGDLETGADIDVNIDVNTDVNIDVDINAGVERETGGTPGHPPDR